MAQILLKKHAHSVEKPEEEFIVLSPVELQIPKPEVSRPQAKSHIKSKKGLSRLFKKGKNNVRYLEELVDTKRLNARLDARAMGAYRNINF
ncbi:MAG: hypothetical protein ACFE9R_07635 [Candidatus Hermodarchaeota archaeon]